MNRYGIVVSCEHGGHKVPTAFTGIFRDQQAVLETHRGWDSGALQRARQIAARFDAPLHASTTTRLLIDLNRSIGHRHLFSEFTRPLPPAMRQDIVRCHYRPHRDAVEGDIGRRIASGRPVIHIASHSFTPVMDGVTRLADVAWLYDPRRTRESALVKRWMAQLSRCDPRLRLRRNYPYQGRDDGLASTLRRRFTGDAYVGIELEVNQRYVEQGGAAWRALRGALLESLAAALAT